MVNTIENEGVSMCSSNNSKRNTSVLKESNSFKSFANQDQGKLTSLKQVTQQEWRATTDVSKQLETGEDLKSTKLPEGLLSRVFRGWLVRNRISRAQRSFAKLQAHVRRRIIEKRYRILIRWRQPWSKYLVPNEAVLFSSLVTTPKQSSLFSSMFKARRKFQLIFTTRFRLLLVNVVSGECTQILHRWNPLIDRVLVPNAANQNEQFTLEFHSNGKLQSVQFIDLITCAQDWQNILTLQLYPREEKKDARRTLKRVGSTRSAGGLAMPWSYTMVVLQSFDRTGFLFTTRTPISLQGTLVKRAVVSKKNWRERWCILRGNLMLWFKGCERKGALMLNEESVIKSCAGSRENCFEVSFKDASGENQTLRVQAKSLHEVRQWIHALRREVVRLNHPGFSPLDSLDFEDYDDADDGNESGEDVNVEEPRGASERANNSKLFRKSTGSSIFALVDDTPFAANLVHKVYKELEHNGSVDKIAGRLVVKAKSKHARVMEAFDPASKDTLMEMVQISQMCNVASIVMGSCTEYDSSSQVPQQQLPSRPIKSVVEQKDDDKVQEPETRKDYFGDEVNICPSSPDSQDTMEETMSLSSGHLTLLEQSMDFENVPEDRKKSFHGLQEHIMNEFSRKRASARPPNPGVTGRGINSTVLQEITATKIGNDVVLSRVSIPPSSRRRPRTQRKFAADVRNFNP